MNTDIDRKFLEDKIDELNQQAWQIRVNDSNKALALSKEAVVLAEQINYTKGKAQGLRTLGFAYIRHSRNKEALEYLNEALELFKLLDDLDGQAVIYGYYGITHRSLGEYGASLDFLIKALELTRQIDDKEGESLHYYHLGVTYKYLGNYERALEYLLQSLGVARAIHYWISESYALNLIGQIYFETDDYEHALNYFHQSLTIRREAGDKWGEAGCLDNIGLIHFKQKEYEEAILNFSSSLNITELVGDKKGQANTLFHLGTIYSYQGNNDQAINCTNKSLQIRQETGDIKGEAEALLLLADLFEKNLSQEDSYRFDLLEKALQLGQETKALDLLSKIHFSYYQVYKRFKNYEAALVHFESFTNIEKELHKDAINQRVINLEISHKVEQSQKEAEIYRLRNVELASLFEKTKQQKEIIEEQRKLAEKSLDELKKTQWQLIHREKLASLGELTAGIAHEIQNPLNFVNNFSETNTELIQELEEEIEQGHQEESKVIVKAIKENELKIIHHGQRADRIVKNMLQHSQAGTGQKKPTDINTLAEEYLRLAYQGIRAKDKDFTANLITDFDSHLGKVEVVPQELGRVLINLFNNAFYATQQKKANLNGQYQPEVKVTTCQQVGQVEIRVRDNGTGIPENVKNKIFQPFFTTKPTGQGTGLGLSLSYDIITKGHGGEIKVEGKEGEYSEFMIIIPI